MHKRLDQIALRVPDGMRDRLKAIAARQNRSLNAQVVTFLEDALERAAGDTVGASAPAAESNNAALARGASVTNG